MNILIIEDEQATALHTKKMLHEIDPGINVLAVIDSVESAVRWFRTHQEPDLLLLDIQLADGVSFDIFREVEINCPIIFTTSYDQYAIQAFRVNSIDYLLKPISKEDLNKALKKHHKVTSSPTPTAFDLSKLASMIDNKTDYLKRIVIRYGNSLLPLEIKESAYFLMEEKIVFMYTFGNSSYPVDFSLNELEARLDPGRWFRVNRQFIISFESIEKMTVYSRSRIKITLRPPCKVECISSTEHSGDFKIWLAGK